MVTKSILAMTMAVGGMLAAAAPANATAYTFTTIDGPGAFFTTASGINDAGQIVGTFRDSIGSIFGFLDTGGSFTVLDVPGGRNTQPFGINNAGQIVGQFEDSTAAHGFLATPVALVAEPSSLALLGVGVIGLGILRRRQRA
jgi:hypothetical protein